MLGELLARQLGQRAVGLDRRADQPGDDPVRLPERHAALDEHVGDVDGGEHLVRRGGGQPLALEGHPAEHPARRRQRQLQGVDGVEEVLLVLLHVLVVGQRSPVHHPVQRREVPDDPRRLRAQQLGRVGVLLLRHDRGARRPGVADLAEPELLRGPEHDLRAQPRQMRRAGRRGGEEVEHEVAVGDGVDRVRHHAREPELGGHQAPVGREVHARQRARAQRQLGGRPQHGLEARRVAPEHPEVRQQVMTQIDGLRALEVRVARHRPVQVRLGHAHDHGLQVLQRLDRPQRVRAGEHRHVGRDLIVARAGRVQLAADGPHDLGEPPLDRHVDVLVGVQEGELAGVELGGDAIEAAEQLVAVGVGDDAGGREHRRVSAGLRDVVGRQAPVEADRRVHRDEHGIGRK